MDVDAYTREQEAEGEDAFNIEELRKRVFRAVGPMMTGDQVGEDQVGEDE